MLPFHWTAVKRRRIQGTHTLHATATTITSFSRVLLASCQLALALPLHSTRPGNTIVAQSLSLPAYVPDLLSPRSAGGTLAGCATLHLESITPNSAHLEPEVWGHRFMSAALPTATLIALGFFGDIHGSRPSSHCPLRSNGAPTPSPCEQCAVEGFSAVSQRVSVFHWPSYMASRWIWSGKGRQGSTQAHTFAQTYTHRTRHGWT